MVAPILLTMLLPRPDSHCPGPWHFVDFHIFLPTTDYQRRPKKVLLSECKAPGTVPYGKSDLGHCITFIKRLDNRRGSEVATFRIKTLHFTWVIHLNWLEKIELREPWPPGRQLTFFRFIRPTVVCKKC